MEKPSDEEISQVLNECMEAEDEGSSQWPGMSYEQGVAAAVRWMLGEGDNPMTD